MKRLVSPSRRCPSWPSAVRGAMLWCAAIALASAQNLSASGQVQRVIDGDTLVVAGIGTVRLIGVDTPETVDPRKAVQFYGLEASAFTKRLAEGRTVRLEFEGSRKDRYDRTRAYVYLEDGALLNADVIREGYGFVYTLAPFSRLEEFRALERAARTAGRGLWGPGGASSQTGPAVSLAALSAAVEQTPATASETVYGTRTGTKYHRAGCRHLARSQIPLTLKTAAAKYQPCKVCKPPVWSAAPLVVAPVPSPRPDVERARTVPARPASVSPAASSGRCQATTRKGTQCSRKAQAGRSYCWQH
jgi:micrococcal nuclease